MPKNQKKEETADKKQKEKLNKIAELLTELFKKEDDFFLKNNNKKDNE